MAASSSRPASLVGRTQPLEHPEAVAERIKRYEQIAGRTKVIAEVDCGFGTVADVYQVDERIVWSKLCSLTEGATRVSAEN